jgi:hypothetical protein
MNPMTPHEALYHARGSDDDRVRVVAEDVFAARAAIQRARLSLRGMRYGGTQPDPDHWRSRVHAGLVTALCWELREALKDLERFEHRFDAEEVGDE